MSPETHLRLKALEQRINAACAPDEALADPLNTGTGPAAAEIDLLTERLRLLAGDVRWLLRAFERCR